MTLKEKQDLMRLLNMYQTDLMVMNDENIAERAKYENHWEGKYHRNVKAQFEHARIIAARLSIEIGRELKTNWENVR